MECDVKFEGKPQEQVRFCHCAREPSAAELLAVSVVRQVAWREAIQIVWQNNSVLIPPSRGATRRGDP